MAKEPGKYAKIITDVFQQHYAAGALRFDFTRSELLVSARRFGVKLEGLDEEGVAKNLGDIIYSFRFRRDFPAEIKRTRQSQVLGLL